MVPLSLPLMFSNDSLGFKIIARFLIIPTILLERKGVALTKILAHEWLA